MKTDLWKGMSKMPHITNLKYRCLEILEGSVHTVNLGSWMRCPLKPTRKDILNSVIVTSEFEMDFSKAPFKTPAEFREHMKGDYGTKPWANVPGLRSKWFWYDEKNCKCGGVYTFFNM